MKKTVKAFVVLLTLICVMLCSSCSGLEITPDMQEGIDLYISAVTKAEQKSSGYIKVTSVAEDNAIEFKTTESVIDFNYTVSDKKVNFERYDYLDSKETARYTCDGETVMAYDYDTDTWTDKTEDNKAFLSTESNPLTTLSLFRVDNNKKVRTNYLSDIKSYTEGEYTVVVFTLKDSTVSTVLKYSKADGIVRESAGHTRSYYIDKNGNMCKIVVEARQNITSNGESGYYKTSMTVEIS